MLSSMFSRCSFKIVGIIYASNLFEKYRHEEGTLYQRVIIIRAAATPKQLFLAEVFFLAFLEGCVEYFKRGYLKKYNVRRYGSCIFII